LGQTPVLEKMGLWLSFAALRELEEEAGFD